MENAANDQLNSINGKHSSDCSEDQPNVDIKIEAEELTTPETGSFFSFEDLKQPVGIKEEIEIEDTLLFDGNIFVDDNKIGCDINRIEYSSQKNSDDRNGDSDSIYQKVDSHNPEFKPNEIYHEINGANNIDKITSKSARLKRFKCEICDYSASNRKRIREHADAIHYGLKNHKCKHCDYSTSVAGRLKEHTQVVHLKIKKHQCEHCNYTTNTSTLLKQHIAGVHQKIRNYKCEHCNFAAGRPSKLKEHINTVHLKLKKYECEYCDYNTSFPSSLKRHIRAVHQRLKKHKCGHCNYTSSESCVLKRHIIAVHQKIRNFKCEYCSYTASRSSHLKGHHQRCSSGNQMVCD